MKKDLHLVAANIRSAYNVGALLRTADSLGVTKVWLAGYTPSGDHPAVKKRRWVQKRLWLGSMLLMLLHAWSDYEKMACALLV